MSGWKLPRPLGSASRNRPELWPAAATIVLLLLAGLQLSLPSSSVSLPETGAARAKAAATAPADPPQPQEADYSAILQAPIFAMDRAPVILAAQPSGNLQGYDVIGTAIAGTTATALIRDTTGRTVRIKPDGILQGWRLVSIERTQLTFDRDGEKRTLPVEAAPRAVVTGGVQSAENGSAKNSNDDDSDDSSSDDSDSNDDEN